MNLNKVFIIGNLTRDPERKSLPSGNAVVNFGIATNRFYSTKDGQKQQEVEFHNIVAYGRQAEIISQYLTKGSMIMIEGRLKTRNWQDNAGVKHYMTEIITEGLQLGPRASGATGGGDTGGGFQRNNNSGLSSGYMQEPQRKYPPRNNQNVITDEEIPVIEAEETPKSKNNNQAEKQNPFVEDVEEEINVEDIPF